MVAVPAWLGELELRERIVGVLDGLVAGQPDAAAAEQLLADLRSVWIREKRWRNDTLPVATVHVAGVVVDLREPRPSCPRYIADRWQSCSQCGAELLHGRWALFYEPGELVGVLGTVVYPASPTMSHRREQTCTATREHQCQESASPSSSALVSATSKTS